MRRRALTALRLAASAVAASGLAIAPGCGASPAAQDRDRLAYAAYDDGLVVVDSRGEHRARVTDDPEPVAVLVRWSPTADEIAFVSDSEEIWTITPDGSQLRKLADGVDVSWSPDGRQLAIVDGSGGIEITTREGRKRRTLQLDLGGTRDAPGWSPDGRTLVGSAGGLTYVLPLDAENDPRVLSPDEETWWEGDPAWSPDGTRIAFLHEDDETGVSGGWVMNADGSGRKRVAAPCDAFAWAHDGQSLLCEVWFADEEAHGVFRYPLEGGPATRIGDAVSGLLESGGTAVHTLRRDGSWSPDRTRFVWVDDDGGVVVSRRDGSEQTRLTAPFDVWTPSWSPDGSQIAYAHSDGAVHVVDADGGHDRRIATGAWPSWSPDGKSILIHRDAPLTRDSRIEVVDVDSRQVRPIGFGTDGVWSPDGTSVAFIRDRRIDRVTFESTLVTVHADGTGARLLAKRIGPGHGFGPPEWAPDGRSLFVFDYAEGADGRVLRVNADGSRETVIVSVRDGFPEIAVSPSGDHVAFATDRGIETVSLPTGERDLVVPLNGVFVGALAWSPGGDALAYLTIPDERSGHELWVVDADGTDLRRVSKADEEVWDFAWKPVAG